MLKGFLKHIKRYGPGQEGTATHGSFQNFSHRGVAAKWLWLGLGPQDAGAGNMRRRPQKRASAPWWMRTPRLRSVWDLV